MLLVLRSHRALVPADDTLREHWPGRGCRRLRDVPDPGGMSETPPRRLPAPGSPLARLLDGPMRPGHLVWIGLRPARRAPMLVVPEALLVARQGIEGDRCRSPTNGPRQVTLVAREHLEAIASHLGQPALPPERLRRNLVVAGLNLLALKGRRFRIGTALLEWSGECAPCSRMEEEFGPGGYNAVRGHGGITARVLEGGRVRIGDAVERMAAQCSAREARWVPDAGNE